MYLLFIDFIQYSAILRDKMFELNKNGVNEFISVTILIISNHES